MVRDQAKKDDIFITPVRTLSVDELKHVVGAGGPQEPRKPSDVNIDTQGRFQ